MSSYTSVLYTPTISDQESENVMSPGLYESRYCQRGSSASVRRGAPNEGTMKGRTRSRREKPDDHNPPTATPIHPWVRRCSFRSSNPQSIPQHSREHRTSRMGWRKSCLPVKCSETNLRTRCRNWPDWTQYYRPTNTQCSCLRVSHIDFPIHSVSDRACRK